MRRFDAGTILCALALIRNLKLKNCHKNSETGHQTQSRLIKGIFVKKIPNFFTGTLTGKHWKISEKQPKKHPKNGQKSGVF